jgi:5-methylcytosine-specific restriction enzyme A
MAGQWRSSEGPSLPRIRGRQLQVLRARLFAKNKWCVLCPKRGTQNLATIRDHIIPLAEGGRDVETNTQGLCQTCSDLKTREESARGVRRR